MADKQTTPKGSDLSPDYLKKKYDGGNPMNAVLKFSGHKVLWPPSVARKRNRTK